jgi:hypothetical protein
MPEEPSNYSQSTETRWETPTQPRSDQIEAGKPKSQDEPPKNNDQREGQS